MRGRRSLHECSRPCSRLWAPWRMRCRTQSLPRIKVPPPQKTYWAHTDPPLPPPLRVYDVEAVTVVAAGLPFRNLLKMTLWHNSNVLYSLLPPPGVPFLHSYASLPHLHLPRSYCSKNHSKYFLRKSFAEHLACTGPLLGIPEVSFHLHCAQKTWSKSFPSVKPSTPSRAWTMPCYLFTCNFTP